MKSIGASEFKTHCLALIDEVGETGTRIMITKRGRPVAQLIQYIDEENRFPQDALRGTVAFIGNVEAPVAASDDWSVISDERS